MCQPPTLTPEEVQTRVGGDAVEPGAVRGAPFECGALSPGTQQCLLHEILSIIEGRQHAVAVQVELAPVALHQQGEAGLVALGRELINRCVHVAALSLPRRRARWNASTVMTSSSTFNHRSLAPGGTTRR